MGESVYACVAPIHAARSDHICSEEWPVIAITGARVNEVPALWESDIGIAKGLESIGIGDADAPIIFPPSRVRMIVDDSYGLAPDLYKVPSGCGLGRGA